jgi:hypothetical protein
VARDRRAGGPAGRLRLQIEALQVDALVTPEARGVVPPGVTYRIVPLGPVRYLTECHAVSPAGD